jgi:hypothetical protein
MRRYSSIFAREKLSYFSDPEIALRHSHGLLWRSKQRPRVQLRSLHQQNRLQLRDEAASRTMVGAFAHERDATRHGEPNGSVDIAQQSWFSAGAPA